MAKKETPIVAIIGRPNVGKSSLLNRLIKKREAIVHEVPGVTRDRIYELCDWSGREFYIVDTGGISPESEDPLAPKVREQAEAAIFEADLIIFLVDAKAGVTYEDDEVAKILRASKKPILLVSNKVESPTDESVSHEMYSLGFGEPTQISALHGIGIGDLLDEIVKKLPAARERPKVEYEASIAIIGRPNVGKSSLLNALLNKERALVSEMPGTTRDSIDSEIVFNEKKYLLVDTAGIKRKKSMNDSLFYYGYLRAIRSIEKSDIVLLVLDASQGVRRLDQKLAVLVEEKGKSCIFLLNKWDLITGDEKEKARLVALIEKKLYFLPYAPKIRVSAKTKRNVQRILPKAEEVLSEYRKRISTGQLNKWICELKKYGYTATSKGKQLKVFYVTQSGIEPPTFVFFVNDSALIKDNYRKFLENKLRNTFGFVGTPIKIYFRNRS